MRNLGPEAVATFVFGSVVLFNFFCLVAVPPGFDLNVCVLLWTFTVSHSLLAADRHWDCFDHPRVRIAFFVVVGILACLGIVEAFRGPGVVLAVCLTLNAVAVAVAVTMGVAKMSR